MRPAIGTTGSELCQKEMEEAVSDEKVGSIEQTSIFKFETVGVYFLLPTFIQEMSDLKAHQRRETMI